MSIGPINNRAVIIPLGQIHAVQGELTRIQNLVINHLIKNEPDAERQQKIRQYVLQTFPTELPLIPPEQIIPSNYMTYFKEIRQTWCLHDKMQLHHLWAVDVFKNLDDLIELTRFTKTKEVIKKFKADFAAIDLLYVVIFHQKICRTMFTDPNTALNSWINRFYFNFDKIIDFQRQLANLQEIRHRKQSPFDQKHAYVLRALEIGIMMMKNPYYLQYFFRGVIGAFLSKSIVNSNPSYDISQVNTFIEMVRLSWAEVNKRAWVTTIHNSMLSIKSSPSEREVNLEVARDYRQHIQKLSIELYDHFWKISCLNLQIPTKTLTWEKCKNALGSKLEAQAHMSVGEFVTDSFSCCGVAVTEVRNILDLFEMVICKNLLPQFYSFDELLDRLLDNCIKVFGTNEPQKPFKLHLESFELGRLDKLINRFFQDVTNIHREFDKQLRQRLPPISFSQTLIAIFSQNRIAFKAMPASFTDAFSPFREGVIFAATKVLSAFEKGQKLLITRFQHALESVDASILKDKKEELLNILNSLCLFQFKPFLDLFMLLRDIDVVLLAPLDGKQEWEEGLHLLPKELNQFLQLVELESLIDLYIEKGKKPVLSQPTIEVEPDIVNLLEDGSVPNDKKLPPLHLDDTKKTLTTLERLKELERFKLASGEKTRTILSRLKKLGVYILRSAGSHRILAHPNTATNFSLPEHDELNTGVSKDLEKWVNQEIMIYNKTP